MLVPDDTAQGHGEPALQRQHHVAAEQRISIGDSSKLSKKRLVAEGRRGREGVRGKERGREGERGRERYEGRWGEGRGKDTTNYAVMH